MESIVKLKKRNSLQIRGFSAAVFPTKVAIPRAITYIWDNIADVRAVSKDFGLMCEEQR